MALQPNSTRQPFDKKGLHLSQICASIMKMNTGDPLANSNLSRTILEINPGVDRKAAHKISTLNKLTRKRNKTYEFRRKTFTNTFELRRNHRQQLYERIKPKLDPAARVAIDRFKDENRKKEWAKLKKLEVEKQNEKYPRIKSGKYFPEIKDQQLSAALESETGQDFSRRSSLKSTVLEIGISRSSSPGATFTENPLASIMRRDSNDKNKPEVVVTKVTKREKTPTPSPREPEERITAFMNLLPAPTPTRFIGKMHKLKADSDKKKSECRLSKT